MKECADIMMNCAGIMISPSVRVKRIASTDGIGNDDTNSETTYQKSTSERNINMKKIIASVIGLSLLGAGFTAIAAPAPANQPQQNGQYMDGNGNNNGYYHRGNGYCDGNGGRHMMRGNHDGHSYHNNRGYHNNRAPVFQSSLTTATPGEALKKMSADAPAISKDGKQYFVRASVRDINGNTLYQSSLSTATPKEALAKMAADAPAAASGQQYYVRAGIMEILPVNTTQ